MEASTNENIAKLYREVSCDLCGGEVFNLQYKLDTSHIVCCGCCGFSFVNPRVCTEWMNFHLQRWASEDVVDRERLRIAFEPYTVQLFDTFLRKAESAVHSSGRKMLDIGCSTGALLSVARDRGWEVEGLEIGEASAGYAREELGLTVTLGSIFSSEFPPESFDLIALTEVIEHLEQPSFALSRVFYWLKPGGVLFLTTPNYDSLYRQIFGSKWWVVNCEEEHIMFFSHDSMTRMLDKVGFETVENFTRGFDLGGMLQQLRSSPTDSEPDSAHEGGYYAARTGKEKLKALLRRCGMLALARGLLHGFERSFAHRWSPTYAWGEQLIVIARKPAQPA